MSGHGPRERLPGPPFLTPEVAAEVRERFGTPCYVYDRAALESAARAALAFPAPFGFTLRYAMKANPIPRDPPRVPRARPPHRRLQRLRGRAGDPGGIRARARSSSPRRCRRAGWPSTSGGASSSTRAPSTSSTASARSRPGARCRVRMNPGLGTGSTKRTNTGGPASSFGIWHEYLDEVKAVAERYRLRITRLHSHVGSGTDPEIWKRCTRMTLELAAKLPEVRDGQPGRRIQGGPHARGAHRRPRRRGRPRARASSWPSRTGTAGASPSRSSPAPIWWRAPARWWRAASTSWTPGGTGTCSPSSTPA